MCAPVLHVSRAEEDSEHQRKLRATADDAEARRREAAAKAAAESAAAQEAELQRVELQRKKEQRVMALLQRVLNGSKPKFEQFKKTSTDFRYGRCTAQHYHDVMVQLAGEDGAAELMPHVVHALPVPQKQRELRSVVDAVAAARAAPRVDLDPAPAPVPVPAASSSIADGLALRAPEPEPEPVRVAPTAVPTSRHAQHAVPKPEPASAPTAAVPAPAPAPALAPAPAVAPAPAASLPQPRAVDLFASQPDSEPSSPAAAMSLFPENDTAVPGLALPVAPSPQLRGVVGERVSSVSETPLGMDDLALHPAAAADDDDDALLGDATESMPRIVEAWTL